MKTIITLFFYFILMSANVFFLLESEGNNTLAEKKSEPKGFICEKSLGFNPELSFCNFIK